MDQLNLALAALTGLATTLIIGGVKSVESRVNVALVSKLGNLTPMLVVVLNLALPKLATLLHLATLPDAQTIANAPVATLLAIGIRELFVQVLKKPDPAGVQ